MNPLLKRLLFVALLFSAAIASAQDKNFYVFLCLGQSNMEGYPGIPEEEKKYSNDRFEVLAAVDFPKLERKKGQWYPATPPLCRPNSGVSPVDYFGRTLVAKLPANVKVGVVDVAVAGSKIEVFNEDTEKAYAEKQPDWMKGILKVYQDDPYRYLVDLAKEAQKAGVIKGILLHQGESNTGDKEWPAKVKVIYERLLHDLNLNAADVPLIAGEVVNADQEGKCASMNAIIDDLPKTIPTAHVVSSAGCPCHKDHLHFTPEGYKTLGTRYAEATLPLLEKR